MSKTSFAGLFAKNFLIAWITSSKLFVVEWANSASIDTPKNLAMSGNREISGQQAPLSHFETDWFVTPKVWAISSCVKPFSFRNAANFSYILISAINSAPPFSNIVG
jgi:hypothetical protein